MKNRILLSGFTLFTLPAGLSPLSRSIPPLGFPGLGGYEIFTKKISEIYRKSQFKMLINSTSNISEEILQFNFFLSHYQSHPQKSDYNTVLCKDIKSNSIYTKINRNKVTPGLKGERVLKYYESSVTSARWETIDNFLDHRWVHLCSRISFIFLSAPFMVVPLFHSSGGRINSDQDLSSRG